MIPLSPAFLITTASSYTGQGEDPHGTSRGRFVDAVLRQVGAPAAALDAQCSTRWDTAFVHYAGFWSHYDVRRGNSSWPLPPLLDPEALHEHATAVGATAREPQAGDVFLLATPRTGRHIRAGIVVEVERRREHPHYETGYECVTIEGDTNACMELGGGQVLRHRRLLAPTVDTIVRWVELKKRAIVPVAA